jgi:hypothetical protein
VAWDFRAALIGDLAYVDGNEPITYVATSELLGDYEIQVQNAVGADFTDDELAKSDGYLMAGDRYWIVSDAYFQFDADQTRKPTPGDYLIRQASGERFNVISCTRDALGLAWDVIGRLER